MFVHSPAGHFGSYASYNHMTLIKDTFVDRLDLSFWIWDYKLAYAIFSMEGPRVGWPSLLTCILFFLLPNTTPTWFIGNYLVFQKYSYIVFSFLSKLWTSSFHMWDEEGTYPHNSRVFINLYLVQKNILLYSILFVFSTKKWISSFH